MAKYSVELKLKAVLAYLGGKASFQTIAHQFKGSVEALETRIKQFEMENAYLKKLNALVQNKEKSPNKTKHKSSMN